MIRELHTIRLRLTRSVTCRLTCDDPEFTALLRDRLRDLIDPLETGATIEEPVLEVRHHRSSDSHPWGVWRDGEPCEPTLSTAYVTAYTMWELNRLVADHPEAIAIHAGAVTIDDRAVVLCGVSHSGKSTLTAWLTAHGCGFLTDELVSVTIDRPDTVIGYHRPIGIRRPGPLDPLLDEVPPEWAAFAPDDWLMPASALTAAPLVESAPLGAVIFPLYTPGAESRIEQLRPDEALMLLCDQSPGLSIHGREGFRTLHALTAAVPCYRLFVDDLTLAAEQLRLVVSAP